jgi:hypothetical protein
MNSPWPDTNNRYLAASLQWLRLKLKRLTSAGSEPSPVVASGIASNPSSPASAAAALAVVPANAPAPSPRRNWFGRGNDRNASANGNARTAGGTGAAGGIGATGTTTRSEVTLIASSTGISAPPQVEPPQVELPTRSHTELAMPGTLDEQIARAAEARAAATQSDPPPALLALAQRLDLSPFERDTLLLCAAADLDPGIAALFDEAAGMGTRGAATFGLALQLFDEPSWDALSPHRPLRYARLLEINQPGATPLTGAALRADERIVHYIKGLNVIDERLSTLVTPASTDTDEPQLSASQQAVVQEVLRQLQMAALQAQVPVVELLGADAGSKLEMARAICAALSRHLYRLSLADLPPGYAELDALARLWQRERLLLPLALYLDADEADASTPPTTLHTFASRDIGPVFISLREPLSRPIAGAVSVAVPTPSAREQYDAWLAVLEHEHDATTEDSSAWASRLAGQFNLNFRDIRAAVSKAAHGSEETPPPEAIWKACCELTQPRLDQLAQRLQPMATWDDLVLPDEAARLLRQIAAQARHRYEVHENWGYARKTNRGLGINALFAGESGTGKTMAAEVIANELNLALYRIDLSAVVSKYIGETEKNLRRLFDAAERGGAILLFDEADALFGKRSEVKDSHDRYANIEINYLLQRMEAFSGLAILATNMKSSLDTAFLRRLRFIVNFPYPGVAERKRIWQGALPSELPLEAPDFDRLARFGLSGGNIHSVALNAAFMAASRGTPITQSLLMGAVRTELRKLDRPINEAEFR